jgi:hypothetical protein
MVRFHISAQNNQKLTCWTPLAANRTPNRMGIRMENLSCRQPLTQRYQVMKIFIPYSYNIWCVSHFVVGDAKDKSFEQNRNGKLWASPFSA